MVKTEISKLSDDELVTLALKHHPRAITCLVDRYKGMIFTLSYSILRNQLDAEEAAQDSFVKALKALDTFRFDCKFSTWLYRISYNNAISMARGYKPIQVEIDSLADSSSISLNALELLSSEDRVRYLNRALEILDPEESAILTLYYIDGECVSDIATITNLTESNVKVRLFRGRKKLYAQLEVLLKEEVSMLL
jgi:RNA polymerase sigma factor (sigma-70 family)